MFKFALLAFIPAVLASYFLVGSEHSRAAQAILWGMVLVALGLFVARGASRRGSETPYRWGVAIIMTFIIFAAVGRGP